MTYLLKALFSLVALAATTLWKLVRAVLGVMPDGSESRDWVRRYEVPHEPTSAPFTRDGKTIIE